MTRTLFSKKLAFEHRPESSGKAILGDLEGKARGKRCSGVLVEAGAGVQEQMRGRSNDGKQKEVRLALPLGPGAGFLVHSTCEGKPLKDFVQETDTIKFLSCENHSSSHVRKTV